MEVLKENDLVIKDINVNVQNDYNQNVNIIDDEVNEDDEKDDEKDDEEEHEVNEDDEEEHEVTDEDDEDDEDVKDDQKSKKKKKKKEKKHYFEHYIRQILKVVCSQRDITKDAKYQLNQICLICCKVICRKIQSIIKTSNKKTGNEIDAQTAVNLSFIGELSHKCIEHGKKCLNNYKSYKNVSDKKISINEKANLIISPSLIRNLIKKNDLHLNLNICIFLAGVIEYFIVQILVNADLIEKNDKVRITINDIELGMKNDNELNSFLIKNNIYFSNSTISSFIHPETIKRNGEKDRKTIENITKLQGKSEHVIPKLFFEQNIKNHMILNHPNIRFQKHCFYNIQYYIEKWLIETLKYSNMLTIYSKKSRVVAQDIDMVISIMERKLPEHISNIKNEDFIEDPLDQY